MLTALTYNEVVYICNHMRERDAEEIYSLRPYDNPDMLASEVHATLTNRGRGQISWWKGRPASLAGFSECHPGVFDVFMFGTEDFKPAAIPLLRWFRQEANEILSAVNGHRLQCDSRCGYDEAHKLIKAMGGLPEGPPMRKYGKDGADYQRFVWFNGENDAVLKPGYTRAA